MRALFTAIAIAALTAVASCDDTPNANFEQEMKDRDAARAGDPYNQLDGGPPTRIRYERTDPQKRADFVEGEAGNYRATYESMLSTLDTDKGVTRNSATFIACRPVFDEVVSFEKTAAAEGPAIGEAGTLLFRKLDQCRQQSIALNGDSKANSTAALLRRFASTGMSLTGMAVVAHGDVQIGMALWREGDQHVREDKPGFRLSANNFGG